MPNFFTKILKFIGISNNSYQNVTYSPCFVKLMISSNGPLLGKKDIIIVKNDYKTVIGHPVLRVLIRNLFMNMNNPTKFIQEFQFEPGVAYNASSSAQQCIIYCTEVTENEKLLYCAE